MKKSRFTEESIKTCWERTDDGRSYTTDGEARCGAEGDREALDLPKTRLPAGQRRSKDGAP